MSWDLFYKYFKVAPWEILFLGSVSGNTPTGSLKACVFSRDELWEKLIEQKLMHLIPSQCEGKTDAIMPNIRTKLTYEEVTL